MNIDELIKEGEGLKETFISREDITLTNNHEGISKWITKCVFFIKDRLGENNIIYEAFSKRVGKAESLTKGGLEEFIGMLIAVKEMPEEESGVYF